MRKGSEGHVLRQSSFLLEVIYVHDGVLTYAFSNEDDYKTWWYGTLEEASKSRKELFVKSRFKGSAWKVEYTLPTELLL